MSATLDSFKADLNTLKTKLHDAIWGPGGQIPTTPPFDSSAIQADIQALKDHDAVQDGELGDDEGAFHALADTLHAALTPPTAPPATGTGTVTTAPAATGTTAAA